MNHMVNHVGPRLRPNSSVDHYLSNLESRPSVPAHANDRGFDVPGYPQGMKGMNMSPDFMKRIWDRREFQGMRATVAMSLMGLMTCLRVLPDDLYHRVMETDEVIPKGDTFEEIVRRFGDPTTYQRSGMQMDNGHNM